MFKCPICGSSSYSLSLRVKNLFKCNRCSITFETPSKFGKAEIITKKEEHAITEDKQGVHVSTGD